ncbi:hypothetical protein K3495_g6654 [Podosphaera aphanis]|nr:hypothetical protein K3495_g6654 [Podosphaera aphanis]
MTTKIRAAVKMRHITPIGFTRVEETASRTSKAATAIVMIDSAAMDKMTLRSYALSASKKATDPPTQDTLTPSVQSNMKSGRRLSAVDTKHRATTTHSWQRWKISTTQAPFLFTEEMGDIDGEKTLAILDEHGAYHTLTECDQFILDPPDKPQANGNYSNKDTNLLAELESMAFSHGRIRFMEGKFEGLMSDIGAAGISTAGLPQFKALQQLDPTVKLDATTAGAHKVKFGIGTDKSLGITSVTLPIGRVQFQVLSCNTPFLICLKDMDNLKTYLNNIENTLIQGKPRFPVVRVTV